MHATCTECAAPYHWKRALLGYKTCLDCGTPAPTRTIVPMHKSNYMLLGKHELAELNPKRTA